MGPQLSALRARARAWPPLRFDAVLGLLVVLEGGLELAWLDAPAGDRLAAWGAVWVIAAGMTLRRRASLAAVALGFAGLTVLGLLPEAVGDEPQGPWLAVLFVVYSMATHTDGWKLVAGTAVATAGALAALIAGSTNGNDYVFGVLLLVAAPVAAGQLLRSRIRLNEALREKAERVERERVERAAEAVAEERARIAGELHDVVAHALGAMTVQSAAARRLALTDGERAAGAFSAVETTGREALTELRRLLGVLRHEDAELALAPQPKLAYVADLVRRCCEAGLPAELQVEGEAPAKLPPGVDLTAYRVVQEALGEARDPGGAEHADVVVRFRPHEVEVEVADDGLRASDRRLLGMHERVRVYGGHLEAGPRRQGGHSVLARLPLEGTT